MTTSMAYDSKPAVWFLDNSNLYHEGQRLSAVRRGWVRTIWEAMNEPVTDPEWRMSYAGLQGALEHELGPPVAGHAFLSFAETVDAGKTARITNRVAQEGWKPHVLERRAGRGEKGVDCWLAATMAYTAATRIDRRKQRICLVAGDGDYTPAVWLLRQMEYEVVLCFWDHAAESLKAAASEFYSLDQWFNNLSLELTRFCGDPTIWDGGFPHGTTEVPRGVSRAADRPGPSGPDPGVAGQRV